MYIQKDNFIIKCEPQDENFVESVSFTGMYKKVADFFGFYKGLTIRIYFMYSVTDFNFFNDQKFEEWICGFTRPNNMIFVFSPSVIEKITIHNKDDVPKIILHELAHMIYHYRGFKNLTLLNEGIATYLSFFDRQISKYNGNIDLSKVDLFSGGRKVYQEGFDTINKIINKYGKDKLFEFLKTVNMDSNNKILEQFRLTFS